MYTRCTRAGLLRRAMQASAAIETDAIDKTRSGARIDAAGRCALDRSINIHVYAAYKCF
jgi:hypothetical protein